MSVNELQSSQLLQKRWEKTEHTTCKDTPTSRILCASRKSKGSQECAHTSRTREEAMRTTTATARRRILIHGDSEHRKHQDNETTYTPQSTPYETCYYVKSQTSCQQPTSSTTEVFSISRIWSLHLNLKTSKQKSDDSSSELDKLFTKTEVMCKKKQHAVPARKKAQQTCTCTPSGLSCHGNGRAWWHHRTAGHISH